MSLQPGPLPELQRSVRTRSLLCTRVDTDPLCGTCPNPRQTGGPSARSLPPHPPSPAQTAPFFKWLGQNLGGSLTPLSLRAQIPMVRKPWGPSLLPSLHAQLAPWPGVHRLLDCCTCRLTHPQPLPSCLNGCVTLLLSPSVTSPPTKSKSQSPRTGPRGLAWPGPVTQGHFPMLFHSPAQLLPLGPHPLPPQPVPGHT